MRESTEAIEFRQYCSALAQNYESKVTLMARGAGDPNLLTTTLRKEIHGMNENLPLYDARTMLEHMDLPLTVS